MQFYMRRKSVVNISYCRTGSGIELPLSLFILDFEFYEELSRVDGLLTACDCDDPVPRAGAVHPFLGDLNVRPTELLDLND